MNIIPFNKPLTLPNQMDYMQEVINNKSFSGRGFFNQHCTDLLKEYIGCKKAYLTPSATSALEFSATLCNIIPGDEVIVPAFTHVATVNAFVRFGAEIVWCDLDPVTKNIDIIQLKQLITENTKAIVAVHYGGITTNLEELRMIADQYEIYFIEDSAMALGSSYRGKQAGSFGDMAAISFHETKNIHCGEGGAVLINNPLLLHKARILHDQGTNRNEFLKGLLPHYTWVESSSNYYMSELQAAFLYPQLAKYQEVLARRELLWRRYHTNLKKFLPTTMLPIVPTESEQNYHMFYLVCGNEVERKDLIRTLKEYNIEPHLHYQPLHRAPYWNKMYNHINLPVTEDLNRRLLRLPLYYDLSLVEVDYICNCIKGLYRK